MIFYQKILCDQFEKNSFLNNQSNDNYDFLNVLKKMNFHDLGLLYANIGLIQTLLQFIIEQHWIKQKVNGQKEINFQTFVTDLLKCELVLVPYLHPYLQRLTIGHLKKVNVKIKRMETQILNYILQNENFEQKIFVTQVLCEISEYYEFENQMQIEKEKIGEYLGLSFYRTFDNLDLIFNLNYASDLGMKIDLNLGERLYEGAGVGVQSGYSTMLTALRYLNPEYGSRLIDLGSGYGRLGFVVGLMRPDIKFFGYEYVSHRVASSLQTVQKFNLNEHTHFYTQDLAAKDFTIPDADIYYMYDPFSAETYKYVLNQLVEISRRQKIKIATKGNARFWLNDLAQQQGWESPYELDNCNLCLYVSN